MVMAAEVKVSHGEEVDLVLERLRAILDETEETDIDELKELCEQLFEKAAEEQADDLLASYYAAYLKYLEVTGADTGLERCALEGINYQKKAGRTDLLIKTYLTLAEYVEKKGDTLRHIQYLYEAMYLSRDNNIYYGAAIIADRLALLYRQYECYDKAVEMSEIAQENMEMSGYWDMDRDEYPKFLINKGYSLLAIEKSYDLKKCVKQLERYVDYIRSSNRDYPAFDIHTFLAYYGYYMGDVEFFNSNIAIAKSRLQHLKDYTKHEDALICFIGVLDKMNDRELLNDVLDFLINICRNNEIPIKGASPFYKKRIESAMFEGDSQTAYELGIELLSLYESNSKLQTDVVINVEDRFKKAKEEERYEQEMLERNEHLRAEVERVRKENEAKTNFISSMSHEIRTPINAVLGMDEMILRESTDETVRAYANDIMNAGKNLLSIVNDILDFSKIEAGKMEIVPQEYETVGMIRDLVNLIMPRVKGKDLKLKLDIAEDVPSKLFGDDVRIKQVITNILTNAVKYTEKGFVEFGIRSNPLDEKKTNLLITIRDTGIGMKEEELDKLFKPFERLDMNRNRTVEGTGLGMSIVLQLLRQMGSDLTIDSVYGEGSTFSFVLEQGIVSPEPVGKVDVDKLEVPVEAESDALFTAHKARVLAIDDTAVNLTVVKGLLKRTGVILDVGDSGAKCLEMCKDTKYDVILLDHRMPELDGVETLRILRSEFGPNKDTPVVALTANAMPGIEEYYEKEGFAGYLSKPINGARLERMIYKLLPDDKLDTEEDLALIVDEAEGIKACGSEETYLQVVKDTVDNEKMIVKELNDLIADGDIKNYTIKVHALKNTARMIGATGVSKEALYLEKCGDEGREELIYKKEGELILHFKKVIETLKEKHGLGNENLEPIDINMFREMVETLVEFVKGFDFDRADQIVAEIKTFKLPGEISESFEKLGNALYNYDADGVIDYANECLKNTSV